MSSRPLMQRASGNARAVLVTASIIALAGLLGACASHVPQTSDTQAKAQSKPDPQVANAGSSGERTFLISALKDAESALGDYARARQRESSVRETVQNAANAALVARHQMTIGGPGALAALDAEQRLVMAQEELKISEAATRHARDRLYRALGFGGASKPGEGGASLPVKLSEETHQGSIPGVMPADGRGSTPRLPASRLM